MHKDGAVAKDLIAIQNAFNHPQLCYFLKYDDLVARPQEEIKKIYQFLELPYFNHRFINLDQIKINGLEYNDGIVGKNMHTIKRNEIKKEYNSYLEKIPKRIKEKYGHIRF